MPGKEPWWKEAGNIQDRPRSPVHQRGLYSDVAGEGGQVSIDSKGRYLDNIFVERLWRSIKYEEVYLKVYQTVAEARAGISAYLEICNPQSSGQALGYRTPAEVVPG